MASPIEVLKNAVKVAEKKDVDHSCIQELVARAFTTRNLLQFDHWNTGSFASHMATGDLYDGIIDKIDAIVEAYMGKFGKLTITSQPAAQMPECICKHIKEEAEWMCDHKDKIANGSAPVKNMLDDLEGAYDSCVYKLENLK